MDGKHAQIWIVGVCVLVLAIVLFKNKIEMIVNVLMRASIGTLLLYAGNVFLTSQGYTVLVGVNLYTIATAGILGVPGILLMYGIAYCGRIM